jgi:5-formyltetrahydrofolate cyclo-ligase
LVKNRFGILEPSKTVDIRSFDVIVVPGVVFDKKCNRLGFGKGFYDRFLKSVNTRLKIGLSYDLQIVDELPSEVHDIPMDFVLTETKIYRRN